MAMIAMIVAKIHAYVRTRDAEREVDLMTQFFASIVSPNLSAAQRSATVPSL